jgi:hypothetical protein
VRDTLLQRNGFADGCTVKLCSAHFSVICRETLFRIQLSLSRGIQNTHDFAPNREDEFPSPHLYTGYPPLFPLPILSIGVCFVLRQRFQDYFWVHSTCDLISTRYND